MTFHLLTTWRKCFTAVEVGVDRAEFAQTFLTRWMGHRWLGVDNYLPYPEMPYDRAADLAIASIRIERFVPVARLMRADSVEAAGWMPDGGTDFVYIDAAHDRASVWADLEAWWPKVSAHGILAGHDYAPSHPGVIEAVDAFADLHGLTVFLTTDDGPSFSWYAYKSGMPGPEWFRNPWRTA